MQYWFTLGGFEPLVQVNDLKCKILAVRGPQLWVCALGWTSWGCTLSLCYMFYLFHAEPIVLLYKALLKKAGQIIPSSLEHFSCIETPAVQTWLTWWVSVCSCSSKSRSTWKMSNQPEPDALLGNTGMRLYSKGDLPWAFNRQRRACSFLFLDKQYKIRAVLIIPRPLKTPAGNGNKLQ